jgi:hypothetical protein
MTVHVGSILLNFVASFCYSTFPGRDAIFDAIGQPIAAFLEASFL